VPGSNQSLITSEAAPAALAIETHGLTKQYRAVLAVDQVDLEVHRGEIFGFLGPNGAGKTTTMRILLGLIRPTSGSARMLGMDIRSHLTAILDRTGSIVENPTFYPYLSGRDNLRVVARLTGAREQEIGRVLDLVDLARDAGRKYRHYSLGMKQRLAVAGALLHDPDVLILDEPANGLDPAGTVDMRNLMRRLKEQGKTVFISSHVLHEIEQICDRIAILNQGRVLVQGSVDDLLSGSDAVEIKIGDAAAALRVLQGLDWVGDPRQEGEYIVVKVEQSRAADVNRILAEQQLYASEIRPKERSLEQYFLGLTERPSR